MATPNAAASLLLPEALMALANLELVARCAVEGFFHGLHRSRRFGFSQEFAEYRAYVEGDDPRFVDWNVFARTERTYIRRYEGETNTRLMIALDASGSMGYGAGRVTKLRYGQFLAASLAYLANQQHDPVGLLVFDAALRSYRPPSSRAGSLTGLLHVLDAVVPGQQTDLEASLQPLREHYSRRGLVAVISDLYCDPAALTRAVQPLAQRGHDIIVFQLLDRQELAPQWRESVLLQDLESGELRDASPDFLERVYPERLRVHIEGLRSAVRSLGAHHELVVTDEPLDQALRRYFLFRHRQG
jgi:uncharacterized protein (DUF58 family)